MKVKKENEKKLLKLNSNLFKSEEQFRMLTEKSNALICEFNAKGEIAYANALFKDILGFSKESNDNILDKCQLSE
ncbi:MAG: PAS domain S-box protein [Bacteroidales bacterium]|nr:PAS domain S-box protein [Bacteroidales bacterium]